MEWPASQERDVEWRGQISDLEAKERIAQKMARRLRDGDAVGVGSGSTSLLTLHALVDSAKQHGWRFTAITTSLEMEMNCANLGVATSDLLQQRPDWSFDGADEIDGALNMIKGRGGAMLREKIIMASSPERYVVVDASKMVATLGEHSPIPLEVVPEALRLVEFQLGESFDVTSSTLRMAGGKDGPVVTENGNLILDVMFANVRPELDTELNSVVGVVGSGLFVGFRPTVVSDITGR
ncbi:MAG: rpiA [Acidimicrobiaceae bacterium]|nr:rpiA [Acidimicrobiaceae bacterium]